MSYVDNNYRIIVFALINDNRIYAMPMRKSIRCEQSRFILSAYARARFARFISIKRLVCSCMVRVYIQRKEEICVVDGLCNATLNSVEIDCVIVGGHRPMKNNGHLSTVTTTKAFTKTWNRHKIKHSTSAFRKICRFVSVYNELHNSKTSF